MSSQSSFLNCFFLKIKSPLVTFWRFLFHSVLQAGVRKKFHSRSTQLCNFPKVYSMALRWSLSFWWGSSEWAAGKGEDSSLSSALLSRHFTQEAIKRDWQPTLPVTWKQACGRRVVAHDRIWGREEQRRKEIPFVHWHKSSSVKKTLLSPVCACAKTGPGAAVCALLWLCMTVKIVPSVCTASARARKVCLLRVWLRVCVFMHAHGKYASLLCIGGSESPRWALTFNYKWKKLFTL